MFWGLNAGHGIHPHRKTANDQPVTSVLMFNSKLVVDRHANLYSAVLVASKYRDTNLDDRSTTQLSAPDGGLGTMARARFPMVPKAPKGSSFWGVTAWPPRVLRRTLAPGEGAFDVVFDVDGCRGAL